MTDDGSAEARSSFTEATACVGCLRVAIGVLQGITPLLVLRLVGPPTHTLKSAASASPYWSSQHPMLFASLALVTAVMPIMAIVEVSRMRHKALLTYLGIAALAISGLAVYDI